VLVVGVFANSLAQVPFWQIQAANRPDLPAKVHLVELPCYLLLFWGLTKQFGIEGAGIAWALRATIDSLIMFWISGRLLVESKAGTRRLLWMVLTACPFFLSAIWVSKNVPAAMVYVVIVGIAYVIYAWYSYLTSDERAFAQRIARSLSFGRGPILSQVEKS
jgi:O-antigen/teichoic acid export membrane protein